MKSARRRRWPPGPGAALPLCGLCLLLGFFLGFLLARSAGGEVAVPARTKAEDLQHALSLPEGPVNINTADEALLAALPGIGDVLAARIVDYREAHGGFRYLFELTQVRGIGSGTFDALQGLITLEENHGP